MKIYLYTLLLIFFALNANSQVIIIDNDETNLNSNDEKRVRDEKHSPKTYIGIGVGNSYGGIGAKAQFRFSNIVGMHVGAGFKNLSVGPQVFFAKYLYVTPGLSFFLNDKSSNNNSYYYSGDISHKKLGFSLMGGGNFTWGITFNLVLTPVLVLQLTNINIQTTLILILEQVLFMTLRLL